MLVAKIPAHTYAWLLGFPLTRVIGMPGADPA